MAGVGTRSPTPVLFGAPACPITADSRGAHASLRNTAGSSPPVICALPAAVYCVSATAFPRARLLKHGNKLKSSSLPRARSAAYPQSPRRQACVLTTQIAGVTRHFAFPSLPFGYVLVGNGISHFLVVPIFSSLSLFTLLAVSRNAHGD